MTPPSTRSTSLRPISDSASKRLMASFTRWVPQRWRSSAARRLALRSVASSWLATMTTVEATSSASITLASERGQSRTTYR